jgi:SAM-dependent methyltransferase
MDKPFSQACERNRIPILKVLKDVVEPTDTRLLEVGSGTGQHAVYFAPHFPHLIWVTSDQRENLPGIRSWLDESGAPNLIGPGIFKVGVDAFPNGVFDVVFTANTFHIMSWDECKILMRDLGKHLRPGARFLVYGPFNYRGAFTSDSNRDFDRSLRERGAHQGIRDFEAVCEYLAENGLALLRDYEMPANNQLLVFRKNELVQ